MRQLSVAVVVIFAWANLAQAQFDQVFGHTQVSATGYYNPAGSDATRTGCSDWLSRSPGKGGCYITYRYHLGQDMIVTTPTYTDGTPGGVAHPVYAIADGVVSFVSKGINGDTSATPGYYNQSGYVSTALANWGTTRCDKISEVTRYEPGCGTAIRKYNIAVVVKHKVASGGNIFAVYGHMLDYNVTTGRPFQNGDVLVAGRAFALIGDWEGTNGRHLHFGVFVPNTNSDFPSIPVAKQKLGLANDEDIPSSSGVSNWQQTYGFTDPIAWLTNSNNDADNYITARGSQSSVPQMSGTPSTLTVPKGGVGTIPSQVQSLQGFSGTIQGNTAALPANLGGLKLVLDQPKVLGASQTVSTQSLVYVPSTAPLSTIPLKTRTFFEDSQGAIGATAEASTSMEVVDPPTGGSGIPVEIFGTALYNDANLVSYWRLEGNSTDAKGNNTGTDTNTTYGTSSGKFGQGLSLSGNGGVKVGVTSMPSSGSMSVAAWVYPAGNGSGGTSPDTDFDGTIFFGFYPYFRAGFKAGSTRVLRMDVKSGTVTPGYGTNDTWYITDGTSSLALNAWSHVVFVHNGDTGTDYIYVNGVEQTHATTFRGGFTTANDANYRNGIGARYYGSTTPNSNYFNGYMDDVAVFSRALTATEVVNLYGN